MGTFLRLVVTIKSHYKLYVELAKLKEDEDDPAATGSPKLQDEEWVSINVCVWVLCTCMHVLGNLGFLRFFEKCI